MSSQAIATREAGAIVERVVVMGDLKELNPAQRAEYYKAVCDSIGLNPLTRPFEYITLNGKLTLYARKDATDQLRKLHSVSVQIVSRDRIDDVYAVTARATDAQGRTDESIGAVSIGNLKGDALCNALMKSETKAKRRVTLSICGLGMLDEAELETIPQHSRMPAPEPPVDHGMVVPTGEVVPFYEPADEPEPEPPPVKPVRVEGVQPTSEPNADLPTELTGAAGHVVALAKKLKWTEAEIIGQIQQAFGTIVYAGKLKEYLEFATKDELRELYRVMNSKGGRR